LAVASRKPSAARSPAFDDFRSSSICCSFLIKTLVQEYFLVHPSSASNQIARTLFPVPLKGAPPGVNLSRAARSTSAKQRKADTNRMTAPGRCCRKSLFVPSHSNFKSRRHVHKKIIWGESSSGAELTGDFRNGAEGPSNRDCRLFRLSTRN
jgi:hypothetical protein